MAKAAPKRKAANGYKLAEPLPQGEILQDIGKKNWKLGPSIGQGGFGEIYSAQEENAIGKKYPYVIKIEPHANGPLFVEMHFYMRNARPVDIEEFKRKKKLKTFGMPFYLGSGSHEYKNAKYRFVVMEKFGTDLWKIFLENNRSFPTGTVFKLGVQILDVLEYIHKRKYVHADIKGANILMGITKETLNKQVYLVDFGLATKYTTEKDFKPNPKKAHDGTIEYLSRDAHKGVQTRRGDLEILAYNLIQWLGCTLPWEKNLKDPNAVHQSKEEYMASVPKMIKACFGNRSPPGAIVDFLNYLNSLNFNSEPDYKKIRKIFLSEIENAGDSLESPLEFSSSGKTPLKRKSGQKTGISPKGKIGRYNKAEEVSENEKENVEDDDEDIPSPKGASRSRSSHKKELSPKRKAGRPKKVKEESEDEKENMEDDEDLPLDKLRHNDNKKELDNEDIIDASFDEEPKKLVRRERRPNIKDSPPNKEELLTTPKKRGRPKKNVQEDPESVLSEDRIEKVQKAKKSSKNVTEEQCSSVDPYEGYTDAMKEVLMKKLENGKSKSKTKHNSPVGNTENSTDGYTDAMKEMLQKKNERLVSKRQGRTKKTDLETASKASEETVDSSSSRTKRIYLPRSRKAKYGDESDSE